MDWLAKTVQAMIGNGDPHVIAIQDVKNPNPRMVAQKGVLLVNRSLQWTFTQSLLGMLLKSPIAAERQVVSKLVIRRDKGIQLLKELKEMGIDGESMLPTDDELENRALSVVQRLEERTARERDAIKESVRTRMESRTPR